MSSYFSVCRDDGTRHKTHFLNCSSNSKMDQVECQKHIPPSQSLMLEVNVSTPSQWYMICKKYAAADIGKTKCTVCLSLALSVIYSANSIYVHVNFKVILVIRSGAVFGGPYHKSFLGSSIHSNCIVLYARMNTNEFLHLIKEM